MDLRPTFDAAQAAFGADATVTPPGGASVPTRVMWLAPKTEQRPTGGDHRRAEVRRVLAIPSSVVPQVPRGTTVLVAEKPGAVASLWKVDSAERWDYDHHRALVVPA